MYRYFHRVLDILAHRLYPEVVKLPLSNVVPYEIESSPKLYPYFKDCIGAIDGTHVPARIQRCDVEDVAPFRNRKGFLSQNVLGACKFNLQFCYALPGWEGSAHDGRVLAHALMEDFNIPDGKYYLADAGYGLKKGFLVPYRAVWYHLREQAIASQR
jgi:hypothetical protein